MTIERMWVGGCVALAIGLPGCGSSDGATAGPAAGSASCPSTTYKTLVIVGDSVSDVGGSKGPDDQQPFYRTLLVQNDDARYPDWKGKDLATCWGLDPQANVVKVSKGGAIATESAGTASVLLDQAKSLPTSLPGPVLVVGTIGGNDALAGFSDYLLGTPAQQKADLDAFLAGWNDAMTELTRADRFGVGVRVDVLIANIYDPSGGTGDFTYTPESKACTGSFALWPKSKSTDPALAPWNDAILAVAAKFPAVHVMDMHGLFVGHQVDRPAGDNWYHDDCIHPNAVGHEHIREMFWAGIAALR